MLILEKVRKIAKKIYVDDSLCGYNHALRVEKYAIKLSKYYKVDKEALRLSALLHDIALNKKNLAEHAEQSAIMAEDILRKLKYNPKKINIIKIAIQKHARGSWDKFGKPSTIIEKLLYDADMLDFLSAKGIIKYVMLSTINKEPIEDILKKLPIAIFGARDRMYTKKSKDICKNKHILMKKYFDELDKELKNG